MQRVVSLMKEMEFLSQLHHTNIVGYMGIEHEGNCTNVFLEYVPGGSIYSLLRKFGSFDEVFFPCLSSLLWSNPTLSSFRN